MPDPTVVAVATAGYSSGGTISVPKPSGAVTGQGMYAWLSYDSNGSITVTDYGGWTHVATVQHTSPDFRVALLVKTVGASEPSTTTITFSTSTWRTVAVVLVKDMDAALYTVYGSDVGGDDTVNIGPVVVPAGAALLCGVGSYDGRTLAETGFSQVAHLGNLDVVSLAGASADGAYSFTGLLNSASAYGAFLIVIAPVAGGGPPSRNTNSIIFNGTSNYGFGNQNDWAFPITNSYTVEAWFKPSALGTLIHFLHKGDRYQTNSGWYLAKDSALLRFGYRNAGVSYEGTVNAADHLAVGVWTHLCMTFDYATRVLTLYVNGGEAIRTGTLSVAPGDYTGQPFRMAANNPENAERYGGLADEVRVWSVCRTAVQIRAYWDKQALGTEPGLYALYRLNSTGTNYNERVGSSGLPRLEFFGGGFSWSTDVAPIGQAGYYDQVLNDSPRGYWRLGEASGTSCLDSSGNNLHGTYGPVPVLAQPSALAGDPDTSASFSQAALSQASIPHNALLNIPSAWTVECWAYVRNHPASGIGGCFYSDLYPGSEAAVQQMLGFDYLVINQGKIMTGFYSAPNGWLTAVSPTTCPLNQWVHWAGVYNGAAGALYLYQNGVQVATTGGLPTFSPSKSNSNKWIGRRWDSDEHPDAYIDEVALYPVALPSARILAHYQAGLPAAAIANQRWTGSVWVATATQRWTGSQWVAAQVKRWNGTAWV